MKTDIAEGIYYVLTKRRYNRGLPNLPKELREAIGYFVAKNQPITLVGFWGIGSKLQLSTAEQTSCAFLDALNQEIKAIYPPGLDYFFIFADQHALHNGYSQETIVSYIGSMRELFDQYGFRYTWLSGLWKKYNLTFKKIDHQLRSKPEDWWSHVDNAETIERNARNRNTISLPRAAAQRYFVMRDLEKKILEEEYRDCIFHAFSDPKLKNVLPHLPTLYFYARPGWSNAPWFVDEQNAKERVE